MNWTRHWSAQPSTRQPGRDRHQHLRQWHCCCRLSSLLSCVLLCGPSTTSLSAQYKLSHNHKVSALQVPSSLWEPFGFRCELRGYSGRWRTLKQSWHWVGGRQGRSSLNPLMYGSNNICCSSSCVHVWIGLLSSHWIGVAAPWRGHPCRHVLASSWGRRLQQF